MDSLSAGAASYSVLRVSRLLSCSYDKQRSQFCVFCTTCMFCTVYVEEILDQRLL